MLNCHSAGTPSILFQKPCIYQHVGILHQIKTHLKHFLTTRHLDQANYQTYFQETRHTCYLFSPFSLPHLHTYYHSSSGHATCSVACTSTTVHNHDQSHWFSFHVSPWKCLPYPNVMYSLIWPNTDIKHWHRHGRQTRRWQVGTIII